MNSLELNNGVEIPQLGFGVFQIPDLSECEESVLTALNTGYRLIDTAAVYENEEAVGKAVKSSGINRDQLFITTKLWVSDTGYEKTLRAFEKSLAKLQLDYLDMYLIHQPYGDIHGSWRAMEELYREGSVRAIGVSNFYPDRVMDLIMHNEVRPVINQIETHPFHQQHEAQKFLEENRIQIESWGPFAEGKNGLFQNEVLLSIAEKHSKTAAQVVLRWLIQRGVIAIPKSVRPERIAENFDVFNFALNQGDMDRIATLDKGQSLFFDHCDPEMVRMLSSRKLNDQSH